MLANDWQTPPETDAAPAPDIAREVIALGSIPPPSPDDGQELIKNGFLYRGGSVLLVGPTGAGKSALAMQTGIVWTVGLPSFGLTPTGALRILYIQAENDHRDLYEFRQGIFDGLEMSEAQRQLAGERFLVATVCDSCGTAFIGTVLRPLLEKHRPDIVIIDPLLAFIGGDVTQQSVVGPFVRQGLQPAIAAANCGLVLVHHPPKPKRDEGQAKVGDDAYFGAGSADLSNWARGIVLLKPTANHGFYTLTLAKRGRRVGWLQPDGFTPAFDKSVAHGTRGLIYWREAQAGEQFQAQAADESHDRLLGLVPKRGPVLKSAWLESAARLGIGEKRANRILDTLTEARRVHLWTMARPHCRAAVGIAREPQNLNLEVAP